jgi:UDP-N-acetylmuramoyl-L-alanyl-D-glutamate--2,6-diaminopimelate ligase
MRARDRVGRAATMLDWRSAGRSARPSPRAGDGATPADPMELSELARILPEAELRGGSARVLGAASDSRRVRPGDLFFCVPGARTDGHAHAPEALRRGAVALAVERWLDLDAPQLRVPSTRAAMGPLSAAVFGHPSRAMTVVGVTGTNGKTTTACMLERAFAALGRTTGLIGTVGVRIAGRSVPVRHTTPEAPDLQRLLAEMRDGGVEAVAMEVSSHGLALGRVAATRFACGVFTNLSRDHLDFHGTMEAYEAAKAALFAGDLAERAAINVDDPTGRRWLERVAIPTTSFAIDAPADVRAEDVEVSAEGSRFTCVADGARVRVRVRMPGRHNVANALAALAAFRALGLSVDAAAEGIASLPGVPGRFERVDAGQDFAVVVDYAHTPDSLERALRAAREICAGRLWVVFGCGGDRDRGKRPEMGRVATALADRTIITSDNPRSEDPLAIVAEIEAGARAGGGPYEVEPDRRAAIRRALAAARPGDLVLIAGKGHETGQQVGDRILPFDDRAVAREELAALGAGR